MSPGLICLDVSSSLCRRHYRLRRSFTAFLVDCCTFFFHPAVCDSFHEEDLIRFLILFFSLFLVLVVFFAIFPFLFLSANLWVAGRRSEDPCLFFQSPCLLFFIEWVDFLLEILTSLVVVERDPLLAKPFPPSPPPSTDSYLIFCIFCKSNHVLY